MPVTSTVGEMADWMKPAVKASAIGMLNSLYVQDPVSIITSYAVLSVHMQRKVVTEQ